MVRQQGNNNGAIFGGIGGTVVIVIIVLVATVFRGPSDDDKFSYFLGYQAQANQATNGFADAGDAYDQVYATFSKVLSSSDMRGFSRNYFMDGWEDSEGGKAARWDEADMERLMKKYSR